MLDNVYAACRRRWGDLGLALNESKLQVFTETEAAAAKMFSQWRERRVSSLKVLGQRLSLRLDHDGLPLSIGGSDSLEAAVEQLGRLQKRLAKLTAAGLPAAVRHQLWLYASAGAVTHLLACSFCRNDQLAGLEELQKTHLEWATQRDVDEKHQSWQHCRLQKGCRYPKLCESGARCVPPSPITAAATHCNSARYGFLQPRSWLWNHHWPRISLKRANC